MTNRPAAASAGTHSEHGTNSSRADAARTLASLIMGTYRGTSSHDDDETLKSILAKHPDLLERRGSTRGSISTRCSEAGSTSQLELIRTSPPRIRERRGTLGTGSLLAPPMCSSMRRSSVPEIQHVVGGKEGYPRASSTRTAVTLESSQSSVRRSSVVTFVSESFDIIPGECAQEARPSTHVIPVFDTSSLERMVAQSDAGEGYDSSSFATEQEFRDNRRNSVLSIVSDGDESAGPSSSPQSKTVPSVPVRRGSLFSVDPTEILGMARTPCFATSPRDVEVFKNGTPKIPRHLVTPHSGKSYSELQRPTPKSPSPTSPPPAAAAASDANWDMSNLSKSEAAEMLQSLLDATSAGVEPDSRDLANVLIGQLIRAHPELVAPLAASR